MQKRIGNYLMILLCLDKPGRVQGLGTGPTPATLWGRTTYILKDENKTLGDRVKDLEERIAKLERIDSNFQFTSKQVNCWICMEVKWPSVLS
ncbi:hypothetical protein Taro_025852 [Colocasia esculenta]|uniref:Uncharacterized protein n=1 Tax=Colocasia esculenta TaxID=4460 RepID=A0A843VAE7_COLES|nr:hypothetical protein [Colocasia esculenta]